MEDKIVKYEDLRQGTYMAYVQGQFQNNGLTLPSLYDDKGGLLLSGTIAAHISHGRWCVDCPFCHSAKLVSAVVPFYTCGEADCRGSETWFQVVLPEDADDIERALMKRPAVRPDLAINRNWYPGEILAGLIEENIKAGLE